MHLTSVFNYINKHLEDYIALAFGLYLTRLLYRLIVFVVFEKLFKHEFFFKLKKNRHIKSIIDEYIVSRKGFLFFFVKPAGWLLLYSFWVDGHINKYKYHWILASIISINILYNLNLSFYKKRDRLELKTCLNIHKLNYIDDYRLLNTEDNRLISIRTRNFYLYFMTRSYYMFFISFLAYYNSLHYFFLKNNLHKNDMWLKPNFNKNCIFFKNISDLFIAFSFANYTIIIVLYFIVSIYFKVKVENFQTYHKTPIAYTIITFFFLQILYNIYTVDNYYNIFIMSLYQQDGLEIYIYFPFVQIFMFSWYYYNSKHLCCQLGSIINYRKEKFLYQKLPNQIQSLYTFFWYYTDFIFYCWFIGFILNTICFVF